MTIFGKFGMLSGPFLTMLIPPNTQFPKDVPPNTAPDIPKPRETWSGCSGILYSLYANRVNSAYFTYKAAEENGAPFWHCG